MKINKLQLNILTSVVRDPTTINEALYYIYPSLYDNHRELALEFLHLFNNGSIGAVKWIYDENTRIEKEFIPTLEEIHQNIEHNFHFLYFLTPKGIELWEEVAEPKWEQHFQGYFDFDASYDNGQSSPFPELFPEWEPNPPLPPIERYEGLRHNGCKICMDKSILEKLVMVDHLLEGTIRMVPETDVWDTFKPWDVNYWKTLPMAHRVTYQVIEVDCDQRSDLQLTSEEREARAWYKMICKWHLDVYQLQ